MADRDRSRGIGDRLAGGRALCGGLACGVGGGLRLGIGDRSSCRACARSRSTTCARAFQRGSSARNADRRGVSGSRLALFPELALAWRLSGLFGGGVFGDRVRDCEAVLPSIRCARRVSRARCTVSSMFCASLRWSAVR